MYVFVVSCHVRRPCLCLWLFRDDLVKHGFISALFQSILMIIVSELGDKTFFIAAILAMRHPRVVVFAGAVGIMLLW